MNNFNHVPVMADEVIVNLNIVPDGIYIDGTLGGGGHSALIAKKLSPKGKIVGIDQDNEALAAAKTNLARYGAKIVFTKGNFADLDTILKNLNIDKVDGILLDLGVSSHQIDKIERGFSFRETEENYNQKLDMRMDQNSNFSAYDIVNRYSEDKLKEIFYRYGEEPNSRAITKKIIQERKVSPIETIGELMEIIKSSIPAKYRYSKVGGTWASNVFRALRIEVNEELVVVDEVIPKAIQYLRPGGRLAIITFHSLEDRIVKHGFRNLASQDDPTVRLITKKPILPSENEIKTNSRSTSAKLRVIEKI